MFSFLGKLFSSSGAGEAIVESVSSGIDKIWYTDEEKADAVATARREGYAVYMTWLQSTTGSRLARRWVALLVTGIWALEHITAVFFAQVAVFVDNTDRAEKFLEASNQLFEHAGRALHGRVD